MAKSKSYEWAKKEIALANKEDYCGYSNACRKAALKVYKAFCKQNPSIYSAYTIQALFDRLVAHKPLTIITEDNVDWEELPAEAYYSFDGTKHYQSKRYISLFKEVYPDGTVEISDNDRVVIVNANRPSDRWTGSDSVIIDELFPITLPYYPPVDKWQLFVEEFLFDKNEGDFDTKGYLYVITPDGDKIEINKFYKFIADDKFEITKDEYDHRKEYRIK